MKWARWTITCKHVFRFYRNQQLRCANATSIPSDRRLHGCVPNLPVAVDSVVALVTVVAFLIGVIVDSAAAVVDSAADAANVVVAVAAAAVVVAAAVAAAHPFSSCLC